MEMDYQRPPLEMIKNGCGIQCEMRSNQVRSFVGKKSLDMPASAAEAAKHACALERESVDLTVGKDIHIGRSRDDARNFDTIFGQMPDQIRKDAARAAGTVRGPRNSDL
jgi:hypothetical protein